MVTEDQPNARLVVLASGGGTNLQAIIDACTATEDPLDAEVVLVVSDNPDAYALKRAADAGIAATVMPHPSVAEIRNNPSSKVDYDSALAYEVSLAGADLVVLAGWMRLLSHYFLRHHTTINLHPAKPGAFPGLNAIERCFEASRTRDIKSGGVMVHFVPDEGVDNGPVIVSEEVPILDGDTLDSFAARVHAVEHRLIVNAIRAVLRSR